MATNIRYKIYGPRKEIYPEFNKQDDGETCVNTNTRKKTQSDCTKSASSNDASSSSTKHLRIFQRPKQKLL